MSTDRTVVVATHPLHGEVAQRIEAVAQLVMNPGPEPWSREVLAQHLAHANGLVAFMTDCIDAPLLAFAPRLQVVAAALKGYDNLDVQACTQRGVWLTIVPDLLTEPTAELAVGLAIAAGRHVRAGDERVRTAAFQGWRADLYGRGLAGSTVAILGLGRLGRAILDRLSGFGVRRVLAVDELASDSRAEMVDLSTALAQADYVFVALPLTPATRKMLGRDQIEQVRKTPVVVNVGRGSVVDEQAMALALRGGQIGSYAADVFAFEDWALADRPAEIPLALRTHPATLFTPHLGSAVGAVRLAIEHRAVDNLLAVLTGRRPADAVNNPNER